MNEEGGEHDQPGSSRGIRECSLVPGASFDDAVLAVCGEVFRAVRPAAGIYVVAGLLQPEMKVEIEVTARLARP